MVVILTQPSSILLSSLIIENDSPPPDPMTFASLPAAMGHSSIEMTATDESGVEYYFTCTSMAVLWPPRFFGNKRGGVSAGQGH